MKHPSWLSYLILFSLFFPIGFWSGRQIAPRNSEKGFSAFSISPKVSEAKYPLPVQVQKSKYQASNREPAQTNTLLLFVNDLNTQKTTLTSAWLLIHPSDSTRLIFLPIFQENIPAEDLVSTFQLDDKNLNKRFVKAIEKRNLLWNAFLVIDNQVKEQMAVKIGSSPDQESLSSLSLLKAMCHILPAQPEILSEIKRFIPNHLIASFDLEASLDLWQFRISAQPYLQCEFPTISP